MRHTTNRPRMTRKKARELLPGDYAITSGRIDKILSVERQFNSDETERVHAEITVFDGYAARADWDGNQEFWCVDTRTNWPTAHLIIVIRAHERNLEPAVLALRLRDGDYEVITAHEDSPLAQGTVLRPQDGPIYWHDAVWLPVAHVNALYHVDDSDHSDLAGRARLIASWCRVNRLVS
nr:MAG TPA: hypothetical protein [Caudoviricetes sp.]